MDTGRRILIKALCWQGIGFIAMTLVGLFATGSLALGGSMALINSATGLVLYILYERIWGTISWGRTTANRGGAAHD